MLIITGLLLAAAACATTAALLRWLERLAPRLGLVDRPGGRKDHPDATPTVGGLAILAVCLLLSLGGLALALLPAEWTAALPGALTRHFPGVRSRAPQLLALFGGATALAALGLIDDRHPLSARLRLLVQALFAALLILSGVQLSLYLPWPLAQLLVSLGFVVFLTNAVNFIDNMNGLMAGSTAIGCLHLLLLAAHSGQLFLAGALTVLLAGLLAFLPRNHPRALVFMGDAGTFGIGFLLAGLALLFTFDEGRGDGRALLLPPLLLLLPCADGAFVITARLLRGVHPFTAGRDHLSHRLVARGLSPRRAVAVLWLLSLLAGEAALVLAGLPWPWLLPSPLLTAALLALGARSKTPHDGGP